ncbi:Flp family type IVb pilin [Sphingosinicella sp. BN140058]|uniref:Flp family type IVb pilin n=1 Tax=Sphingosinicella sp. BN140058 TaxID=1892855 RepID=UPI00101151C0|nr:Flp family type IVb pilin [Sphingosinicella sp. BN140058]QAY78875.1 Flp family type IVb pilin [Sphingosinicella sp. BN140058]
MKRWVAKLVRDEKAATAIEYGMICALIVVAGMVAMGSVGGSTIRMWNTVSNNATQNM